LTTRKNPEVKQFPYTLNSFDAPFPKRFALRQLELMNSGKTKEEAYAEVSREMQPEKQMLFACVLPSSAAGFMRGCRSSGRSIGPDLT
jgi:hypothetical protein